MPNALAYLMLLVWPFIALALFNRLPREKALIWSILGAYMLLPPVANFNLPGIPDIDKFTLASICALVLTLFVLGERPGFLPTGIVGRILVVLFVVSPFATTLTNPESISMFAAYVPALRLYDSIAYISYQAIALIPFFLGRHILSKPEGPKALVQVLVTAGLVYSIPMMIEVRLSPQINVWVYGFFAHDFGQSMRGGGFRPMVFMPHGLWVAFFALMAAMSALVILRHTPAGGRAKALMIWLYLMLVLVFCRSTGPMTYAAALIPTILFIGRRWQILIAASFAIIVITYPALRGAQLIPLDAILELAYSYDVERHQSLAFRIRNEEILLDRAAEKPWFGWGGYGRNLILNPMTGEIETIPDGQWIITLGSYGWMGYIAEFGLLTLPLLLLAREAMLQKTIRFSPYLSAIALIYAANLVDLLPNATLIPFSWLMAGTILGHAEVLQANRRQEKDTNMEWSAPLQPREKRRTII
ncbi:MAG: hypothetical protein ACK5M4_08470 [Pseudorhodobacter sp.]